MTKEELFESFQKVIDMAEGKELVGFYLVVSHRDTKKGEPSIHYRNACQNLNPNEMMVVATELGEAANTLMDEEIWGEYLEGIFGAMPEQDMTKTGVEAMLELEKYKMKMQSRHGVENPSSPTQVKKAALMRRAWEEKLTKAQFNVLAQKLDNELAFEKRMNPN